MFLGLEACEEGWSEPVGFHLLSGLPCVPTASAHKPGEIGSDIWGRERTVPRTPTQMLPQVTRCHK